MKHELKVKRFNMKRKKKNAIEKAEYEKAKRVLV
jgi:hypothetical protein